MVHDVAPSLAERLVAESFGIGGSDLLIGGIPVRRLAAEFGTPFFAYDAALIRRSYRQLAAALDGFAAIHYSIKANPHPAVIRVLLDEGAGVGWV